MADDDGMHEPVEDLARARKKHQLSEKDFVALEQGESFDALPLKSVTGTDVV